jgi:HSP20 family protein
MGADYERSFRLDVIDHDNELVVRGELPGVEKDDIEVTIMGDRLMIVVESEIEEEDRRDAYYRHEVGFGKLMRTVALPVKVDAEKIRAELKDGILEIMLPNLEVAERHTFKVA